MDRRGFNPGSEGKFIVLLVRRELTNRTVNVTQNFHDGLASMFVARAGYPASHCTDHVFPAFELSSSIALSSMIHLHHAGVCKVEHMHQVNKYCGAGIDILRLAEPSESFRRSVTLPM